MSGSQRAYIIGVGDDGAEGLTRVARQRLDQAECVIGPATTLARLDLGTRGVTVGPGLDELVETVSEHLDKRIVIVSTGDPLFYGVARFLCDRLGKDHFEVVPHVSSMQLAFARVKESWDDAYLASLATQPLDDVLMKARLAEKIGLFTTDAVTPHHVAQAMLSQQLDYFTAYVCENLGSPDERVTQADIADLAHQEFAPLNVMVLVRKPLVPDRPVSMKGQRLIGNLDEMFLQAHPKRGLLTAMEVRVVALAEMDLGPASIVWDVGAGSGAVAIEAARLARDGQVFAIEMDPEDHELMRRNIEQFAVGDVVKPVLGAAPEAWDSLPNPDAIFVGGTGRVVSRIVAMALERLKSGGRLVANVNSLDNVLALRDVLRTVPGEATVRMIQISHETDQLDRMRLESMNPTFLVSFVKAPRG